MQHQTFHSSASKVLFISQVFSVIPTSNMLNKNVYKLRYKWLSFPVIYASIIMIFHLLEFGMVTKFIYFTGMSFHSSGTIALYVVCILEHVFFWRLAIKWPEIMQQWRRVEELFLKAPYNLYATFNMKFWICFWYGVVMSCAGFGCIMNIIPVEHICLMFNSFHKSALERDQCNLNMTLWESLYGRERPHLRSYLPFRLWLLPVLEWLNLTLAYPRCFTDAFVIMVSIGLATRFRQLYMRMKHIRGKPMPSIFWQETREHYLVLKKLMSIVSTELSPLILLACANNMYFICFQLFNSFLNIGVDWVAEFAFWSSLLYNILRTILTFYLAALVDEYTKKIISCLRDVPSRSWCMETQRFSEQLFVDPTAFTGCGFFYLTRKLILAMAGTVITYQIMVADVINEGSIKQVTDYCSKYFEEPSEQIEQIS